MRRYIVAFNCCGDDYDVYVNADSQEEACEKASYGNEGVIIGVYDVTPSSQRS